MKFKNINTNNIISASQEFIDSLQDSADYELIIETQTEATLDELKLEKIAQLKAFAQNLKDSKMTAYWDYDIATFSDQKRDFINYEIDNTSATPTLDDIAMSRGIPRETFIAKVAKNIKEERWLVGNSQRVEDLINAATIEQLNELDLVQEFTPPVTQ